MSLQSHTEPVCRLIGAFIPDCSHKKFLVPAMSTVGVGKLISLRSRSWRSPWHDSAPRDLHQVPPPPGRERIVLLPELGPELSAVLSCAGWAEGRALIVLLADGLSSLFSGQRGGAGACSVLCME